ncbi:MAG: FtsX-like permease family protein [Leptospiraceae bacterium]|nr:FtsX-like permease family protein [Leptospiraceae bacterium]MCP5503305.1 FtsX-like permease family protein [Leptospiraceae bacterium]
MNLKDKLLLLFRLGLRNILRQKKRSYLVMSTAAVGMIGVLFTLASINGYYNSMILVGIQSGLGHIQIRPDGYQKERKLGMYFTRQTELEEEFKRIQTLFFSARFEREGLLKVGARSTGVVLMGIEEKSEINVSYFSKWLIEGNFFETQTEKDRQSGTIPCLIGKVNSLKYDVKLNETLVLSFSDKEGDYKPVLCRIQGVFQSPSEPVDKFTVLLPRKDLSNLYAGRDDYLSYYVGLTESIDKAQAMKGKLLELIGKNSALEVLSYKDLEPSLVWLMDVSVQFGWIANIIIMSGFALVLFESISMSVFERIKEIGILRAIGSSPSLIFWMVLFESSLLSIGGSILGILGGGLVSVYYSYKGLDLSNFAKGFEMMGKFSSTIYPTLSVNDILGSLLLAIVIGIISGVYPAIKAIRVVPVKAIYNR